MTPPNHPQTLISGDPEFSRWVCGLVFLQCHGVDELLMYGFQEGKIS